MRSMVSFPLLLRLLHHLHAQWRCQRFLGDDSVAQRAAKSRELNLSHISGLQADAFAEGQGNRRP